MADVDLYVTRATPGARLSLRQSFRGALLSELSGTLFESFVRSDQRRKGMQYVRGLLETPGRKSIRNIAALLGEEASEQNLHHFIRSSTWDWAPVRRALAAYLMAAEPTQAWVVKPMLIPKTGQHSVGVDKHFSPALGQVLNAQRAVGVWAASEELSAPVNWRLHLPKSWLEDEPRRIQVAIPEGTNAATLCESTAEACLETATRWDLPARPVVLDLDETHTMVTFRKLHAAGLPVLARLSGDPQLLAADPALTGRVGLLLPAHHIMRLAMRMRRPVPGGPPAPGAAHRTVHAAAVRVALPFRPTPPSTPAERRPGTTAAERRPGQGAELRLLGTGEDGARWPAQLWLTNIPDLAPPALARLGALTGRVERDFADISERVGIRDFTGRSFNAWHRHSTLASAAHAVAALTRHIERADRAAFPDHPPLTAAVGQVPDPSDRPWRGRGTPDGFFLSVRST